MLFLQIFVRTLGGQIFQNSNEGGEFYKEWEGVLPQFYNEGGEIRNEGGAPHYGVGEHVWELFW